VVRVEDRGARGVYGGFVFLEAASRGVGMLPAGLRGASWAQ
jgi:hypothetical protein